jgi:EAL and modified HD-GYP domain-containing signal transduction protein
VYEKFIARQPIFNEKLKLFAYELLFRASPENCFRPQKEASRRHRRLHHAFRSSNAHRQCQGLHQRRSSALQRGAARVLPPNRVIIEILETIAPTPEVVQLCKLCASGYVLALDDYIGHPKWEVLLSLVKFLKVDFRAADSDLRADIVRRPKGNGLRFLAEKVETQSELDEARALGYSYFQGYFFCKPSVLSALEIPGNILNYLHLLAAVSTPGFSREDVKELLKSDLSLVYKLRRYMNSPLLGLRGEIHGVREAIDLLGETEFRRWISILAIIAMAGDKPPELIRTAITRGFFCEAMSEPAGISPQGSDLFFMGLLSVTDAILDRPIEEILASLPISAERSHCSLRRRQPLPRHLRDPAGLRTRRLARVSLRRRPPWPDRIPHPRLLHLRHPAQRHASLLIPPPLFPRRGGACPSRRNRQAKCLRAKLPQVLPSIIQKKRRDESLRRAGKLFLSTNYAATSSSTAAM